MQKLSTTHLHLSSFTYLIVGHILHYPAACNRRTCSQMRCYFSQGSLSGVLLCILLSIFCISYGCFEDERISLLDIRVSLSGTTADFAGMPASWLRSDDCCLWEGVVCNNSTRRISHLNLSSLNGLYAPDQCQMHLNSTAFSAFSDLQFLDFSMNYATFQSWDGTYYVALFITYFLFLPHNTRRECTIHEKRLILKWKHPQVY